MYIIKFAKPGEADVLIEGSYPYKYILEQLIKGKQLVIISLYSNTIKVPSLGDDHGIPMVNSYEVDLLNTMDLKRFTNELI